MLDLLYAQAARARRRWYERHPETRRVLQRPVLSIGNVSVGGTGKTPLVAVVAGWLIEQGERPAILSRGYGRRDRDRGVIVVSDGVTVSGDLDRCGDEPLMLARNVRGAIVAVCEDRHLAGVLAERRLGATVHVLDDGFQHVALARDLDVIVTSPGEIGRGRVLPFGRLREAADAAARAQLLVVVGADEATARAEAWELGIGDACGATRRLGAWDSRLGSTTAAFAGQGNAVFAVAGIGNPQQFFDGLRDAGLDVRGTRAFPDHHRYTVTDARAIADAAAAAGANAVVTTEKDAVRLDALGPLPFVWTAVPLVLEIEPRHTLFSALEAALARAREAA